MNDQNKKLNFYSFVLSYVSLSVIAGLFTYRLLNSFLEDIILPLLDISILPQTKFHKLSKTYNHEKKEIDNPHLKDNYIYMIKPGLFLKELIIWCFMMLLLYFLYRVTNK